MPERGDVAAVLAGLEQMLDELGDARLGAVLVHDFAYDAGGRESGEAGEVVRGLGLAGTDQEAAFAGAEREDVAGAGKVGGAAVGVDGPLSTNCRTEDRTSSVGHWLSVQR
jgi:hypothetical protein